MNVDLKNHLENHLTNPHLNFIISHNCKYCKLDRRLQFGKLFQTPKTNRRNDINSFYYQLQSSHFYNNSSPQTIITSNTSNQNIINYISNSPIEYNSDNYLEWELSENNNSQVSINKLNNNSEVSIFLRGITKPERCSICYDFIRSFQIIRTLNCQHYFHQKCIDKWLESKTNCPICRSGI